ncbi:MAG: hypothetical protein HOD63_01680 [Bacteroidetes bacterium]|nr:hypothetical protein [Bacteroidota bacterium]MBT5528396.1 hypothetical protein [Cytophagia bacterium]MBT3423916.1 hypothetical protein [Bacteroidota bacterium]MBT3802797.1 hypothetical protein [Bacteroidota bacterium]MBT3933901.1 hypothetical protein [Bacteroidota bacterium]
MHIHKLKYSFIFKAIVLQLVLVFLCNNLVAQQLSSRKINLDDFLGRKTIDEFNTRIYYAAISGKINAYKTEKLIETYSPEERKGAGGVECIVEICPDQENPDYCYDSILLNPFSTEQIRGSYIAEQWWLNTKKNQFGANFYAFAPACNLIIAGQNLGTKPLFWINLRELNKVLNNSEIILFKQAIFKETQYVYSDSKVLSSRTKRKIDLEDYIGTNTLFDQNLLIYSAAFKLKCPAYTSVDLDSVYTAMELFYRGTEDVYGYRIPEHLNDEIDSTLVTTNHNAELKLNSISETLHFNKQDFSYTSELNALALREKLYTKGEIDLFWVSYKDLKKVLSKLEIELLTHAIYKATVDQHHMYKRD